MKADVVDEIRMCLRQRLEVLARAAQEAHAAATDPGSKAEGKYDTRSLEASYLAAGQARQVEELAEALRILDLLVLPDFDPSGPIDAGALVEVEVGGEPLWYLLAPVAGGMTVSVAGVEVTVVTPASAVYRVLLGMRLGDSSVEPDLLVTEIL